MGRGKKKTRKGPDEKPSGILREDQGDLLVEAVSQLLSPERERADEVSEGASEASSEVPAELPAEVPAQIPPEVGGEEQDPEVAEEVVLGEASE